MRLPLLFALAVSCLAWSPAVAQELEVGTEIEDYARMMQLTGQLPVSGVTVRPAFFGDREALAIKARAHPWGDMLYRRWPLAVNVAGATLEVRPIEVRTYFNSARPWGWYDGPVWQGKGFTFAATGGAALHLGPVSLTLAPVFTRSNNEDFELSPWPVRSGRSEYAYPAIGGSIDAPQRFGNEPVQRVDWGNTNVSARVGPLAAGWSHESLWWGPGQRNEILMTNNAPGFWHAHLSLVKPISIGVGTVRGRWIWGSLEESGFFDSNTANDRRYFTGLAMSYMPRWLPGIEIGAARAFVQTWTSAPGLEEVLWVVGYPMQRYKEATVDNPNGGDSQDQMASVFGRWVLPESGLELYAEWAKGDASWDIRDLYVEPEHGSGYLVGLHKVISHSPQRTWRFMAEMLLLGAPRTTAVRSRGASFFYVNGGASQGYTNLGQILGAGIGSGSSQFTLALDRFATRGKAGVAMYRTVYDNDAFYRRPNPARGALQPHQVETSLSADVAIFLGHWDVTASLITSNLLNRYYIELNDQWNTNLSIGIRYHPSASR